MRRQTRKLKLGNLYIGGDAPISVQSMTITDTRDIPATVDQIKKLQEAKCDIVRVAVPDMDAAKCLEQIQKQVTLPLIADIHFDYRLALEAIRQGIPGLRLNPGNIPDAWKVREVVKAAKEKGVPIRVGVNAGSISKEKLLEYGGPTPAAMVASAKEHIRILEDLDFFDIKVSLKASDIARTLEAYRKLAAEVEYPFHIGISEAGTYFSGTVKSSIGVGMLLAEGLGDTLRISLAGDPLEEVKVGLEILKSLKIRQTSPEVIACPLCGRCEVDLIPVVQEIEQSLSTMDKPISVAVMGCVVNGPGEAREADLGIACGKGVGLIFKKGEIIRKVSEEEFAKALIEEAKNLK